MEIKKKITLSRRLYEQNRRKNDVNYTIILNTRTRIYSDLNGQGKSLRSKELRGIDLPSYKKWFQFQVLPHIKWSNTEIDHIKPYHHLMFRMKKNYYKLLIGSTPNLSSKKIIVREVITLLKKNIITNSEKLDNSS